jgi:hypothetical protein
MEYAQEFFLWAIEVFLLLLVHSILSLGIWVSSQEEEEN